MVARSVLSSRFTGAGATRATRRISRRRRDQCGQGRQAHRRSVRHAVIAAPGGQHRHPGQRRQRGRGEGRPYPRLRPAHRARRPEPRGEFHIARSECGRREDVNRQVGHSQEQPSGYRDGESCCRHGISEDHRGARAGQRIRQPPVPQIEPAEDRGPSGERRERRGGHGSSLAEIAAAVPCESPNVDSFGICGYAAFRTKGIRRPRAGAHPAPIQGPRRGEDTFRIRLDRRGADRGASR